MLLVTESILILVIDGYFNTRIVVIVHNGSTSFGIYAVVFIISSSKFCDSVKFGLASYTIMLYCLL